MSFVGHAHVFFLGHGELFEELRSHVSDLAALRQIRTCYWIDCTSDFSDPCVRVIGSGSDSSKQQARPHEYLELISTVLRQVDTTVVVVDVEDLTDGVAFATADVDRWLGHLETYIRGHVARVRMVLPRLPLQQQAPPPRDGWSTLVLAPEDADSPLSTPRALGRENDPYGAAVVFAPMMMSLTGLWSTSTMVPVLDETGRAISTSTGEYVRLARAFHRNLDASVIENQLLAEVLDVKERVPQTDFVDGRQTVHMSHSAQVNAQYAEKLLAYHEAGLMSTPQPLATPESIRQEGFAAIKAFVKEFFKLVIGSPTSWSASIRSKISEDIAGVVQRTLYGEKTMVEVVVGAGASRATMAELKDSSEKIIHSMSRDGFQVGPAPSLATLWNHYTDAALTLVDGASRLPGELAGPVDSNKNPMVVRRAQDAVPDVEDSFNADNHILRDIVNLDEKRTKVMPFDVHRSGLFEQELQYAASQTADSTVMAMREEFHEWKQKASTSFAWNVGQGLVARSHLAQNRAKDAYVNIEAMRKGLESLNQRDFEAENRRLSRRLHSITALWLLLMVLIGYSTIRYYKQDWQVIVQWPGIDWRWCLLGTFLVTVVCLAIQMSMFAKGRRGIIDEVQRKKLLEQNLEITLNNYNQSVADIHRVANAYTQFLSWSMLLGRVLAYPFGQARRERTEMMIPTSGLPRSTQLGRTVLSPEALHTLSHEVRGGMFEESWAGNAWSEFVADASQALHDRTGANTPKLMDMFGLPGYDSGSTLDELAHMSVSEALADWDRIHNRWAMVISDPALAKRVELSLGTVEFVENGVVHTTSREQFLSALKTTQQTTHTFANSAVNPAGVNHGATQVAEDLTCLDLREQAEAQLTHCITLAQFGRVVPLDDIVAAQQNSGTEVREFSFDQHHAQQPMFQTDNQTPDFGTHGLI
ncbi:hypothetical protein P4N68_03610 [Corynebacterium felinum]|uniref:Uncharacterized protein n=1 Tax=Corynebacterium felinum TaxID=131318 RepID=A0ABU2B5M7_9CORY|nr:hypothetical protein [Corynebacterium felinum]MDF5820170.1 hypothetical protein [Corynebacterium felinum]MDR7353922.1 hypothetical protein [Corynebacterium felinum]WJY96095.1 hypothetical protein CFELI_12575 [Corynebacterium felinum]